MELKYALLLISLPLFAEEEPKITHNTVNILINQNQVSHTTNELEAEQDFVEQEPEKTPIVITKKTNKTVIGGVACLVVAGVLKTAAFAVDVMLTNIVAESYYR